MRGPGPTPRSTRARVRGATIAAFVALAPLLPAAAVAVGTLKVDAALPYVWDLESFGAGPVPGAKKVRLGMTCAMCHYSLDVDWDGKTDLRSAELDRPTPGSPYRPEHSWAVGNQDLYIGWLLALSQNPLVATLIFSGSRCSLAPRTCST